jgi:hypothetical protein
MPLHACSRWAELVVCNQRLEDHRAAHKQPTQPDTNMKRFIILIIALAQLSFGENLTLVASGTGAQAGYSQSITLNQGDSARLLFGKQPGNYGASIECSIDSKSFELPLLVRTAGTTTTDILGVNPVVIAGPATIILKIGPLGSAGNGSAFATFEVTRTGIASPPAEIPQEAGTTWNVILESSSDLINWTPANPGTYSGTEPKRFFRTRMVKQP